jgi:hypothetical protein
MYLILIANNNKQTNKQSSMAEHGSNNGGTDGTSYLVPLGVEKGGCDPKRNQEFEPTQLLMWVTYLHHSHTSYKG